MIAASKHSTGLHGGIWDMPPSPRGRRLGPLLYPQRRPHAPARGTLAPAPRRRTSRGPSTYWENSIIGFVSQNALMTTSSMNKAPPDWTDAPKSARGDTGPALAAGRLGPILYPQLKH